jgi:hypothetical protein
MLTQDDLDALITDRPSVHTLDKLSALTSIGIGALSQCKRCTTARIVDGAVTPFANLFLG